MLRHQGVAPTYLRREPEAVRAAPRRLYDEVAA